MQFSPISNACVMAFGFALATALSTPTVANSGMSDCAGDLDGNGTIDGADLSGLLATWGNCLPDYACEGDLNGDGIVDGADLSGLLAQWGACEAAPECPAEFDWSSEFMVDGMLSGSVNALAEFDDGRGPTIYAGGSFLFASGGQQVNRIARWDGFEWTALGDGISGGNVLSMTVHDDGTGPSLYVAGSFTHAGGVATGPIARWDGTAWHAVGEGVAGGLVRALESTVLEDGPSLFVAGSITSAGGMPIGSVARWRGQRGGGWEPVGIELNGVVRALKIHQTLGVTHLYAGGEFSGAGIAELHGIARCLIAPDSLWEPVGLGLNAGGKAYALHVHEDAHGRRLYVGGSYTSAGGVPANDIASWDGENWQALGSGTGSGFVQALVTLDLGFGPNLYVGGHFSTVGGVACKDLARWSGTAWSAVGIGLDNPPSEQVTSLATFGDGVRRILAIGGSFVSAEDDWPTYGGGLTFGGVAQFDGSAVRPFGHYGPNGPLMAAMTFEDGQGDAALYVGGWFIDAGGVPAANIARWDGSAWSSIGNIGPLYASVLSMAVFDSGSGPELYVGGSFLSAGGVPASCIAKWDGEDWSPVGSGVSSNGAVKAMTVFDDGSGPALYVGGQFIEAGGVSARRVAKWDGVEWSSLGTGISGGDVKALAVFDDGSGPALYAGGQFAQAGGVQTRNIARWNGTSWQAVGGGLGSAVNDAVWSLCVFDGGDGPELFAGGVFTGSPFNATLARWNGSAWIAAPVGYPSTGTVTAMTAIEGPDGPLLIVAPYSSGVVACDGSGWRHLGNLGDSFSYINAFHFSDLGTRRVVYAVGDFRRTESSSHRGLWNHLCSLEVFVCNDSDPCTVDTCEGGVCVHTPVDADGDGYAPVGCGGGDCDDGNPEVHPGMTEVCGNGLDDDCNGLVDCEDQACEGDLVCDALDWAMVLEFDPNPAVVLDSEWRERIIATGLPWRVQDNASGIEMLLVPPGTFMMGCSASILYECDSVEYPVHEVTLTQAFYLARYEVTQAQWTAVMGSNPSYFWYPTREVPAGQVPYRPVDSVSWNMIQGFEALTGLRLPTEAEWEYACRAGTQTSFNLPPNGTNADSQLGLLAWYDDPALQTRPVGLKLPNNLGFHDMHGNVFEWVEDWYGSGYYAESPLIDPPGPISGERRVCRGGNSYNSGDWCRASNRPSLTPGNDLNYLGFRAARTP